MLASESVVLKAHGFNNFKDVKPGEAVIITKTGEYEFKQVVEPKIFARIFLNTFILLDLIVY